MIEIHRSDAVRMLRRVRERSRMTLKEAAAAMRISPSLLARKERGEAKVERKDIRDAVEVYNLAPWEAYELWLSAGFVPEKTLPPISRQDVYTLATDLLLDIKYPASLTDAAGYIRAWNSPYERTVHVENTLRKLRSADASGAAQVHMIDLLFSKHIQECLGEQWESFADQIIERFYRQTIKIANELFYPSLINRLKEQYGSEFIRQWNRVQTYSPPDESTGHNQHHIAISYPPEIGQIEYIIVRSEFQYSPGIELNVHMPIRSESQKRYEILSSTFDDNRVHLI